MPGMPMRSPDTPIGTFEMLWVEAVVPAVRHAVRVVEPVGAAEKLKYASPRVQNIFGAPPSGNAFVAEISVGARTPWPLISARHITMERTERMVGLVSMVVEFDVGWKV